MVPFCREENQIGCDRVLAPNHPRTDNLEPTSPNSVQAIGGSFGKYSDRRYLKSAARSVSHKLAGSYR